MFVWLNRCHQTCLMYTKPYAQHWCKQTVHTCCLTWKNHSTGDNPSKNLRRPSKINYIRCIAALKPNNVHEHILSIRFHLSWHECCAIKWLLNYIQQVFIRNNTFWIIGTLLVPLFFTTEGSVTNWWNNRCSFI